MKIDPVAPVAPSTAIFMVDGGRSTVRAARLQAAGCRGVFTEMFADGQQ